MNMFPQTRTSTFRIVAIATMAVVVFGSGLAVGAYVWHGADMPSHVTPAAGQQTPLRHDEATALDKRIDDANIRISDVVIALTIFALLMTVIIGGGTLVGFFGARQRAREAAEQWMEEHAEDLKTRLKKIESRAIDAERLANEAEARAKDADRMNLVARQRFDQFHADSAQFTRELEEARGRVKATMTTPISPAKAVAEPGAPNVADATLSEAQRGVLKTADQLLREKPESEYSVLDWENRAVTAFGLGDFENAAAWFRKAAFAPGAEAPDIARSYVNRGIALGRTGRLDDAISVYEDVILYYKDEPSPLVREQIAKAFVNKIASLYMLEKFDDAVKAADETLAAYTADDEPAMRALMAQAVHNKGESLTRLRRFDEAVKVYDDVVGRYGDATEPAERDIVIDSLISKGLALSQLERFDDAVGAVDAVLKRFDDGAAPSTPLGQSTALANASGIYLFANQPRRALEAAEKAIALTDSGAVDAPLIVLRALANKADALARLDRKDEALAVLEDVLRRYKGSTDATMRNRIVEVEFMKAVILGWLGRMPEAIAAFDDLISRYSASTNEWVRVMVEKSAEYHTAPPDQWKFVDIVWHAE